MRTTESMIMKSARRRSRELVVQGLYQWLVTGENVGAIDAYVHETPDFHKADEPYYKQMFYGVIKDVDGLRATVAPHLDRKIEELSPVEHAVLLVAAHELTHELSVPYKVVINEAVEIAKSFGGTDGFKYVNGVLDKIASDKRALEVSAES